MKSLLINTYDSGGGAARAAYRLLKGLRRSGIDARLYVQSNKIRDQSIIGPKTAYEKFISYSKPYLDTLPIRLFYPSRNGFLFSPSLLPDNINRTIRTVDPDIVHLHWIAGGFARIGSISKIEKPVIWSLHDSWAFTGGCHIPFDCTRYQKACGLCPTLHTDNKRDLSYCILRRKKKAWSKTRITFVSPSRWLENSVKKSSLFQSIHAQSEMIPNALDTAIYKPVLKPVAREILSLPINKKIILFGAIDSTSDRNKGYKYLVSAVNGLRSTVRLDELEIIIFGAEKPLADSPFDYPARYYGYLNDDISLALLYSAADVMVVPSIQESFGQTASEALSCATPVVAFNTSGLGEIIDHKTNGYLAECYSVDDLRNGILWILEDDERRKRLSAQGRSKAESQYSSSVIANRYIDLYERRLNSDT